MSFNPITVPGVSGEVTTTYSFLTGYRFFVDGQRIKPHGFPRNRLSLPGTSGPVEAKVKGGMFRAHPSLVAGGTEYPTGPPTPRFLQVLGLLPLLSILALQGVLGFLLAFGGVAVNMSTIRGSQGTDTKVALLVLVFVVIAAIDTAVWVAVLSS